MNLKRNITAAAMALSLVAGVAMATTADTDPVNTSQDRGCGMMNGQGPHHGMKGHGGKGMMGMRMMGGGQDCGMEDCGKGMRQKGKGMMSRGGGMHHGAAMNPEMREQQNQFMDATTDLRKEMHDKRFALREAQRDPSLTQGELQVQKDEIFALRQQLRSKHDEMFPTEQ